MTREPRQLSPWVLAAVAAAGLGVHAFLAAFLGKGYGIPTTIVGLIAGGIVLTGPIGKALAQRLTGPPPADLPPEQVLNELDELRGRISELEERADFSERLLAKHREQDPMER